MGRTATRFTLEGLPVREHVLAHGQADHLRAEELAVPVEGEAAGRLLHGAHHDPGVERLPELHLTGQQELSTTTSLRECQAEGGVVDRDPRVLRSLGGGERPPPVYRPE